MVTYRHTDIEKTDRDIHACRHTDIQKHIYTEKQIYIHTYIHTYRHTDIQTDRSTDKQTDKHTYRQTYRQTYTHTDIYILADIQAYRQTSARYTDTGT